MSPFETRKALETLTLLVDTREKPTLRLKRRLQAVGLPYERQKLDFGDYSAKCTLYDGSQLDLSGCVAIERKMSLDELCQCFGKSRPRFEREFARAKAAGARLYLLVENGSWEMALAGDYESRMTPQALVASLAAWQTRYDCRVVFCKPETTGRLIWEILYREAKERLEGELCGKPETETT